MLVSSLLEWEWSCRGRVPPIVHPGTDHIKAHEAGASRVVDPRGPPLGAEPLPNPPQHPQHAKFVVTPAGQVHLQANLRFSCSALPFRVAPTSSTPPCCPSLNTTHHSAPPRLQLTQPTLLSPCTTATGPLHPTMAAKKKNKSATQGKAPAQKDDASADASASAGSPTAEEETHSEPPTPGSTPATPAADEDAAAAVAAPAAAAPESPSTGDLSEALAEIQALKAQLKARDDELAALRQQLAERPAAGAAPSALSGAKGSEEMQRLQDRLAQLKKEQAEADAAREAAWRQLKGVVQEISKLASPEHFARISTPTGAGTSAVLAS